MILKHENESWGLRVLRLVLILKLSCNIEQIKVDQFTLFEKIIYRTKWFYFIVDRQQILSFYTNSRIFISYL